MVWKDRIKPSNHSSRCLGASNIIPIRLIIHIFQCVIAANSGCLRFVGRYRRRKFRELPTFFPHRTGVLRAAMETFQEHGGEEMLSEYINLRDDDVPI